MADDKTRKTARWLLPQDALRLNGLKESEDGTLTVPVEVVRPGRINNFNATKELVDDLVVQGGAVLVDDHEADTDGIATHIGGIIEGSVREEGTDALVGNLRTFNDPKGQHFASLIREHRKSLAAGGPPIVALSVGVKKPRLADGVNPEAGSEPPWDAIGGKWDHVMLTRADYQAQPDAGIRATLSDALDDYFGTTGSGPGETLITPGFDRGSAMADSDKIQATADELKAKLEARDAEAKKLSEELESIKATAAQEKTRADELQTARDNAERDRLVAKITDLHEKLAADLPVIVREGNVKVDLKDATLDEVRPLHIAALEAFAENPPSIKGAIPPREATPPDSSAPSGPAPLRGLFDDVPRKNPTPEKKQ